VRSTSRVARQRKVATDRLERPESALSGRSRMSSRGRANSQGHRSGTPLPATKNLLFVGNFSESASTDEIRQLFAKYGEVSECEVLVRKNGESRGMAFVKMRRSQDAQAAKEQLEGFLLNSWALKVRWALDTATLWVGDLAPDISEEALHNAFKQFGDLVSVRLSRTSGTRGSSMGHAYVEFGKRTVAAKVQQLLSDNLFLIGNTPRPVRVEFALDASAEAAEIAPINPEEPPPHFAQPGTLEFDFALKWRELTLAHMAETEQLYELHRQERQILQQEQRATYEREVGKHDSVVAMMEGRLPDRRLPERSLDGSDLKNEHHKKRARE